jgi:hypothetical protein
MDELMQASNAVRLEVEGRLDRYARVRLSPTQPAAARMRAAFMGEVRLGLATQGAGAGPGAAARPARTAPHENELAERRARRPATLVRRGAAVLLAAGLSVGVAAGAMAASQPGGPLYETRVWLEMATLPSDAASRADAQIVRLQSRLDEILAAAAAGDNEAVQAALVAYHQIADEALAGANGDAGVIERLQAALSRHLAVLEGVLANVPWQAQEAIQRNIERAIDHTGAMIRRMNSESREPAGPTRPATTRPDPDSRPTKTPKPTPVATPPTPKVRPTPEAKSEATPVSPAEKPAKTPPAHARPPSR